MADSTGRRALTWAVVLGTTAIASAATGPLRVEPITLKSYDGRARAAERVRLTVPADPATPGRTVDLAFYRLRPAGAAKRPPLVFLMGGPGIPATVMAPIPPYFSLFDRLAEGGDVILLDQRGLGESTPKSDCPPASMPLPGGLFETPAALLAGFARNYRACAASLAPAVRASDFTIDKVADDVEAIRRTLGVRQVDLLGFSFGTRIAIEVARRHPTRIRRMVLQGVLGLETLRAPSLDDGVFMRFAAVAASQAQEKALAPDLVQAVRLVQRRAAKAPLSVTIQTVTGESRQLALGRDAFNAVILAHQADPSLPAALTRAADEDYSLLVPWIQGLYQDLEKGAGPLMARVMVCSAASGASAAHQAAREAPGTLLGEALDNEMQRAAFCGAFGIAPPTSQAPVKGRVPALLISGSLDPRTPPDRAEVTRRAFPDAEHVIVQNGGHELLPLPEVQDLVVAFLDGRPDRIAIAIPPPQIRTIEEARRPSRGPGR